MFCFWLINMLLLSLFCIEFWIKTTVKSTCFNSWIDDNSLKVLEYCQISLGMQEFNQIWIYCYNIWLINIQFWGRALSQWESSIVSRDVLSANQRPALSLWGTMRWNAATSSPIVCTIHHIRTFLQIWIKAVHHQIEYYFRIPGMLILQKCIPASQES